MELPEPLRFLVDEAVVTQIAGCAFRHVGELGRGAVAVTRHVMPHGAEIHTGYLAAADISAFCSAHGILEGIAAMLSEMVRQYDSARQIVVFVCVFNPPFAFVMEAPPAATTN
jgi:hypothetical protein